MVEEGGGLHYSSEELTELSQLEEVVALLTKLKLVDQARVGVLWMGREVGVGGSHLSLLLENTRKVYLGAVRDPVSEEITDYTLLRYSGWSPYFILQSIQECIYNSN